MYPLYKFARSLSLLLAASLLLGPSAIAKPLSTTGPIMTQISPTSALERAFKTTPAQDWFTPQFLAAVPVEQIRAIITQLSQDLGTFQSIQPEGEGFAIQFSGGMLPAQISLTDDGKISGLLFGTPIPKVTSLEDAIAPFKKLPGKVSLIVLEGKTTRVSLNPTLSPGVGSAFKLAVLSTLRTQIAQKKLTWETIVPLQSNHKSLPSGTLQTWPEGTVLTVQTLAALMISQSDNTATDHLIQLVGRENIEAIAPKNKPFLMTRELFQLKSNSNTAILERYRKGTIDQKRLILKELANQPLPKLSDLSTEPKALDVEWFFTPEQLCQLINNVSDLPLMSINPGVARSQDWQKIAFKGGSEPGVLNLTTSVTAKNGKRYCIAATWNSDRSVDEAKFMTPYSGLLQLLR
jgi:beta-lactamase class A